VLLWGDPGRYLNALAGQDAGDAAGSLYAPQYVVGGTWRSTLSVVNLDDQRGEVSFEFTPRSGDPVVRLLPIPPRGKIHLGAQDFFVDPAAGLREGHVKVSGNGIRLAGNVVFGDSVRHDSSTALPLVGNMQSELIFSHLVSDAGYYTGIALLNPNSAEADVSLEVYDSLGARLTAEPAHIAGNRSQALILDMLRGLAGISLGSGYIRVKSNQPIAGFALFATRSNSAISAIPAQHIR
jgi:hypothetical protein